MPEELQIELMELQCSAPLKSTFGSDGWESFYQENPNCPETGPNVGRLVKANSISVNFTPTFYNFTLCYVPAMQFFIDRYNIYTI